MHSLIKRTQPVDDRGEIGPALFGTGIVVVVLAVIVGIIMALVYFTNSYDSTDGGHVAIIRNGGPFDNTNIAGVLPPNSGRTNIGEFSSLHNYPVSQRYFTISSSSQNADANESVIVPTSDGVQVGIEGTAYFTLNTSSANSYKILKDFDNKYGTRSFTCTPAGSTSTTTNHVYDGDNGFSCFLDVIVAPIINNDLRSAIGDLRCSELVASCGLVLNSGQIDASQIGKGNVNLSRIEQSINSSLQQDLDQTLGEDFLQFQKFNLAKIDLPPKVQTAIDDAQAAFASATKAKAQQQTAIIQAQTKLKEAQIEAQANEARQKGYSNCSFCGQIDIVKALPHGITVYAPGNSTLTIPAK